MDWQRMRLTDMWEVTPLCRPASRAVAVAIAAGLFVAACSDGEDRNAQSGGERTTTTSSSSTSSTTAAVATTTTTGLTSPLTEAAVLSDYTAAKVALEEAERIPDPSYLPLTQRWRGEILKEVQRQLLILQMNGWVIRGTTARNPKVVGLEGTTAVVWDCIRTDGERYDAKTNEVVNPTGPLTIGFEETLVHEAGIWKISGRVDQEDACAGS